MVIKSTTAHIFHVGDARIYRVAGNTLEQLTEDHRVIVSSEQSYLGRALGINPQIEIDYQALQIEKGDVFLLATDGAYEHVGDRFIVNALNGNAEDLDKAAGAIVEEAYRQGSPDNLTVQIVRIDQLPDREAERSFRQPSELPLPPLLEAQGRIRRLSRSSGRLHASSRSHIYLAADIETDALVAIKIPSIDLRDDPAYLKRFMMEEWVARRIDSPHVLKPCAAVQETQLPLCRDGIHRWADPDAMDDRQSEAGPGNGARHRRANRQGLACLSPAWRCCIRT